MYRMLIKSAGAAFLFFVSPLVNATSVTLESCTVASGQCVTAISELNVNGAFYDVSFVSGSFNSLFPDPASSIPFWNDEVEATIFAQALYNEVTAAGGSGACWTGYGCFPDPFIPFAPGANEFTVSALGVSLNNSVFSTSDVQVGLQSTFGYVRFTPAPVPVPAAAWLFLSALGLLGYLQPKKAGRSF